ncbi:hypothetical protein P9027_29770 [Bacillus thuringiensis]|uniref:hypothetical protein n=1 Tax=Bacillus thuringiensis TaxID=1428 RepID=UPI002DB88539|nr:hypothetical protein [Bacillus thuringiensis]MEC3226109.1 hypothetical protein [Bacillus thuringiensis]MEC3463191.1 hypothetical protein [Bacillus thuringiensis]MEC3555390.1 hypothetical protein [Bacillus thuringiensis]MED2058875.1 hypothetical protein [Bacillus thuringiensis]
MIESRKIFSLNRNLVYWHVEELDKNIVLVTLKKNNTVANKIVLHLYQRCLMIGEGGDTNTYYTTTSKVSLSFLFFL